MTQRMKMADGQLVPLTDAERAAQPPAHAPARKAALAWRNLQAKARAELDATDYWIIKASETGAPVHPDRLAYRAALRAIASAETGDPSQPFPVRPA